jgi:ABC-type transporter MlaC component
MRVLVMLAAGLLILPGAVQAGEELPDPARMVEETAEEILRTLREERDQLEEDPRKVYQLVEELMLPRFDVQHSARLVLGRHAREATPEQRRDFTRAFYRFLVRSYAEGLLEYRDEEVRVRPTRGGVRTTQAERSALSCNVRWARPPATSRSSRSRRATAPRSWCASGSAVDGDGLRATGSPSPPRDR